MSQPLLDINQHTRYRIDGVMMAIDLQHVWHVDVAPSIAPLGGLDERGASGVLSWQDKVVPTFALDRHFALVDAAVCNDQACVVIGDGTETGLAGLLCSLVMDDVGKPAATCQQLPAFMRFQDGFVDQLTLSVTGGLIIKIQGLRLANWLLGRTEYD